MLPYLNWVLDEACEWDYMLCFGLPLIFCSWMILNKACIFPSIKALTFSCARYTVSCSFFKRPRLSSLISDLHLFMCRRTSTAYVGSQHPIPHVTIMTLLSYEFGSCGIYKKPSEARRRRIVGARCTILALMIFTVMSQGPIQTMRVHESGTTFAERGEPTW